MPRNATSRDALTTSFLLLAAFLLIAVGAGCDALTGAEPEVAATPEAPEATAPLSKLRHAHLFASPGAGKILDRYSDAATYTDFILSTSTLVLDVQKVLDRYEAEEGVTVKRVFKNTFNGFAIHVDAAHVDRVLNLIEGDGDITWAEPDARFIRGKEGKTRSFPATQQKVSSLNNVKAHISSTNPGDGTGSVNVDLYIIDTGVDHPDLNIVERVDFATHGGELDPQKILDRYKVLDRYTETMDPAYDGFGHGTHVAGIAAAIDDTDALVGVAPAARIHDFRVFDTNGAAEISAVIAALEVVEARKILNPLVPVVVNLSLGADIGTTTYNALDEAVVSALQAGVVVVVAAGNDAIDAATVTPAHVTEALTVGSTKSTNRGNEVSTFSNRGSLIDLFAHGEQVMSLSSDHTIMIEMTGTSMAAPLVAGTAALYLSKHPLATPAQVRSAILGAADRSVVNPPSSTTDRYLNVSSF